MSMDAVYKVLVSGASRKDGVWVITASLWFPPGVSMTAHNVSEARVHLLRSVLAETSRGLAQGFVRAVVHLDLGDGVVAKIRPDAVAARLATP